MNISQKITLLINSLILTACASNIETTPDLAPQNASAPSPQAASAVAAVPYPTLDYQNQIDELSKKINKLEQEIEQQKQRIQQLEHRPNIAPPLPIIPKAVPHRVVLPQLLNKENAPAPEVSGSLKTLEEAQKMFENKQYRAVLTHLRGADNGGDGSETAQQKMFLMLKSAKKLNLCQTVIQIGRGFSARFEGNAHAAQALMNVAECQFSIQQQDIARDTWRDVIRRYPQSSAAREAEKLLKKK